MEIALCKWWICITPWKFFLENDRHLQLQSQALDGLCECCQSAENSKAQDKNLKGRGDNNITPQFSTKWEFPKYIWYIINFQLKDRADAQENRSSNKNHFALQTIKASKHQSPLSLLPPRKLGLSFAGRDVWSQTPLLKPCSAKCSPTASGWQLRLSRATSQALP